MSRFDSQENKAVRDRNTVCSTSPTSFSQAMFYGVIYRSLEIRDSWTVDKQVRYNLIHGLNYLIERSDYEFDCSYHIYQDSFR